MRPNIVPKQETSYVRGEVARAVDALEEARGLPPGPRRIQALKQAGLLRHAADSHGLDFAKPGGPRAK
jgi:hypothetical protein